MDAKSYVDLKRKSKIPDFRPGDSVRVHAKVVEGDRERIQVFEGVVIRIRTRGPGSSFTVRRVTHGVGVERAFPYHSPLVEKVDVTRVGRVRRARLYYLRDRVGKAARIKPGPRSRFDALTAPGAVPEPEPEQEYIEEAAEIGEDGATPQADLTEETAAGEGKELAREEGVEETSADAAAEAEVEDAEGETEEPPSEPEEAEEPTKA